MSIASDLNRAHSRALAAAKKQGHEMTVYFSSGYEYISYCRTEGCGASIVTHSPYGIEGTALDYACDPSEPEDPFAAFEDEADAPVRCITTADNIVCGDGHVCGQVIPDEVCA